jgi:membrane fusion protein (multidrug efflux system)
MTMKKLLKKWGMKKIAIGLSLCLLLLWGYFHYSTGNTQTLPTSQGIVLGSDDLAPVTQEDFLVRVPISGELYPLEQTTVIAKVGAETQAVYVREGESVKKNQLLAELNTADLQQTLKDKQAALSAAEASYRFSTAALKRYKKLLEKSYYSQNDYDSAINQLRINEAATKQAKAAFNEAELQLSYARIVSSLNGIVSERNLEPGMNVSTGQTLFKIVNLDQLEWRAMVPADEISHISINQTATFRVDGLEETFAGKVVRINPSTVAGTRAYYAYIAVDNPAHRLKNGMFATGSITLSEKTHALVVPYEAIRKDSNGSYVYKIDVHHRIQKQPVTLGLVDALSNKAEVLSGLKASEWVIASSAEVQSGSPVILPIAHTLNR